VALTASGQSIIEFAGAPRSAVTGVDEVSCVLARLLELGARLAPWLAQQSRECIDAQASPVAIIVSELAGMVGVLASAVAMFSQPSMQPAPAIHKATANASTTRTTFIEERKRIWKRSVTSRSPLCRAERGQPGRANQWFAPAPAIVTFL